MLHNRAILNVYILFVVVLPLGLKPEAPTKNSINLSHRNYLYGTSLIDQGTRNTGDIPQRPWNPPGKAFGIDRNKKTVKL